MSPSINTMVNSRSSPNHSTLGVTHRFFFFLNKYYDASLHIKHFQFSLIVKTLMCTVGLLYSSLNFPRLIFEGLNKMIKKKVLSTKKDYYHNNDDKLHKKLQF